MRCDWVKKIGKLCNQKNRNKIDHRGTLQLFVTEVDVAKKQFVVYLQEICAANFETYLKCNSAEVS